MGTPAFAVASLDRLIQEGFRIAGVVTAPDRPAGRGKKISFSAVKQYMLEKEPDIPLLQPVLLKDPGFIRELSELKPDLQVVVAFRMLPEAVWSLPEIGTLNLHASLLPQYRGAAPINHVIINGEQETGVTTFLIDAKIDTGNILLQRKTFVGQDETAGELHDRLMVMGAELVVETVTRLASRSLQARSQELYLDPGIRLKTAPKITREMCQIDWNRPVREIVNLVRGLSPSPAAFSYLIKNGGEQVLCKIYAASNGGDSTSDLPGTVTTDGRTYLNVAAADGIVQIRSIQQEGRRRMGIKEFLAGISQSIGPFRFS